MGEREGKEGEEREREGREGRKRGRGERRDRAPKLLLNQGPSELCYATVVYHP